MDLSTITIDPNEARKAVVAYRRALQYARSERARREDEAILRGYREIARGHPIISLRDVVHAGGEFSNRLPKIAIARADEPRISVSRAADGAVRFGRRLREYRPRGHVKLPAGTLSRYTGAEAWRRFPVEGNAIVPIIPPELRPNASLERYWVLFEAEWQAVAPRDPALLRDLGGGLYAVLATWDLTELERAVLGMTRAPA
jgi:hypothetical protein